MNNCLFCKIINKEIPSEIRYEDDVFLAFNDINPKAKTHILLVTKKHIASISELKDSDQELMGKMILKARDIAKKACLDSFRLVFNSGRDSGQEIDHLHLHILGGNKLGDIA